ncbi:MAG: biotin--[acetyl-CoA-carboxylase] ligase [bacterium]|nr:biotin--[acetyl-CoA-carboxylase] ligase [bacterium]
MTDIDYKIIRENITPQRFGRHFLTKSSLPSTNTGIKEHLKNEQELPLILTAEEQTGGKGRMQRSWHSPSGKGIWISTAFPPVDSTANFGHYNFMCSLVISSAIEEITGIKADLKWPNDILIGGKKVCGILSESISCADGKYIIITGMGLNVNIKNTEFPVGIRNLATSLLIEAGKNIDRQKLLLEIISNLNEYYDLWQDKGIEPIYFQWISQCTTIGKSVEIKTEKQYISGTAINVNKDGSLLLEEKTGKTHRIYAGDLEYIIN